MSRNTRQYIKARIWDTRGGFGRRHVGDARIRVAAEWKRPDLLAVTQLVEQDRLSLDGLITHTEVPGRAHEAYEVAFGDSHCLKMVLNWSH